MSEPPRASAWRTRRRGYLLAAVATASWSPDAVLPRLARRHYGGNTLNIVFWKFLLVGLINLFYAASLAPRGGVRRAVLPCTLRRKGVLLPAVLATLFTAATNTCFATAYMTTAAANAVVLIEINPLWGAALGWLFLSDVLPVRTAVAIAVGVACAFVAFLPEIIGAADGAAVDTAVPRSLDELLRPERVVRATWYGNLVAIGAGLFFQGFLLCCRFFGRRCPGAPTAGLACWGALGCAMTAAIVAVAHGSVLCPPHAAFYPLIIGNGALAGLAWVCCIKACQLVTGAEVGLILLADMPLVPFWVYLGLGEVPSPFTIGGGLTVWATLGVHGWLDYRAGREAERRDGAARRLEESHLEGGKRTAVSIEKV